jgi:hypothetical protein
MRNTGDHNVDALWEMIDKIEDIKGRFQLQIKM